MHQRANQVSCWLQSVGIEKGDRVAVMLNICLEFMDLYVACARLGAVFVPINFRLAAPEIDYTLKNCRPRLFVFWEEYLQTVKALNSNSRMPIMLSAILGKSAAENGFIYYNAETALFAGQKPFLTRSLGPADPEEPQVIMYTSGTTGQPKGVVLTYRKTF